MFELSEILFLIVILALIGVVVFVLICLPKLHKKLVAWQRFIRELD